MASGAGDASGDSGIIHSFLSFANSETRGKAPPLNAQRKIVGKPPATCIVTRMESYIQNLFAERIGGKLYGKGTAIYKFEKIKRAKRAALAANPGAELIDMGVGEPDEMAFADCVEALAKAARKPENRGYADNGARPFQ